MGEPSDNADTVSGAMAVDNVAATGEFPFETNAVAVVRNTAPVTASISPAPTASDPAQMILRHLFPPFVPGNNGVPNQRAYCY